MNDIAAIKKMLGDDGNWHRCNCRLTIRALVAEVERLRRGLKDFADYGVRHDLNPTRIIGPDQDWKEVERWWTNRCSSMDAAVRERAKHFLAGTATPTITEAPDGE